MLGWHVAGEKMVLPSFSAPTHSSVQLQPRLDGLSATCKDFTRIKRASPAPGPVPVPANINRSSHTPRDDRSGQWQSAEKERLPSWLRQEDKALPCYFKQSIYA